MDAHRVLRVLPNVFNRLQDVLYHPIHPLDYGEEWGSKPCWVRGEYWFTEYDLVLDEEWKTLQDRLSSYPSCYIMQHTNLRDYYLVQTMPMGSIEANSYVNLIPDRYRAKKVWSEYLSNLI